MLLSEKQVILRFYHVGFDAANKLVDLQLSRQHITRWRTDEQRDDSRRAAMS